MNRIQRVWQSAFALAAVVGLVVIIGALFRARSGGTPATDPLAQVVSSSPPATVTTAQLPYPAPSAYPPPMTVVPRATPPPLPTVPPVPTPLPTPIVTPVPTAIPPFIPLPPAEEATPYTVIFRDGNVLRAVDSDSTNVRVLLDVGARLPLFLADRKVGVLPGEWGSISPDGHQLALVLSNLAERPQKGELPQLSIYLFDLTTGLLRPLLQDATEPVWSPDGTRIAYRSTRTFGLWVVDVSTGATQEVFEPDRSQEHSVSDFTWSPDSSKIALVETVGGISSAGTIWIVDAAPGGPAMQLIPTEMYASNLHWSDTGDQLLFISRVGEHLTPTRLYNLWSVDLAKGQPQQLTQNISVAEGVDWSPDGNWVIFGGANRLEGEAPPYDLWLISKDGTQLRRVTSDRVDDLDPLWVSDHNIVFQKVGIGLIEMNMSNGVVKQLNEQIYEYTGYIVAR